MNKLEKVLLVLAVFLLSAVSVLASFPDVLSDHPNFDAINYVQEKAIVAGYPDGDFKPDNLINRAEFTKIIVEATVDESIINTCLAQSFSDVPLNQWFAKYVCVAKQRGIIDGYPDGNYKPGNNINFAESAKIIVKGFGYQATESEPWYRSYVEVLGQKKAIPTTIVSFGESISRGQMAEMIYRLKANVVNKPSRIYGELMGGADFSITESWQTYQNEEMGITIKYPNADEYGVYTIEEDYNYEIYYDDQVIVAQHVRIGQAHPGEGIGIDMTMDAAILDWAQRYEPFTGKTINGLTFQEYHTVGMGSGYGYVIEVGGVYYCFNSIWGPYNEKFEFMLQTLEFDNAEFAGVDSEDEYFCSDLDEEACALAADCQEVYGPSFCDEVSCTDDLVFQGCEEKLDLDTLAQCITDKGYKLYTYLGCPHCTHQKEVFGDSLQYIDWLECNSGVEGNQRELCLEADIPGYPTWVGADGEQLIGYHSLEELAVMTGCEL